MVDFNWSDNVIERAPIRARTVAASLNFLRRGRRSFNTPYNLSFNSRLSVALSFSTRVASFARSILRQRKGKSLAVWIEIWNYLIGRTELYFIYFFIFSWRIASYSMVRIMLLNLEYSLFNTEYFVQNYFYYYFFLICYFKVN